MTKNIIEIAKSTILTESKAIEGLVDCIGDDFVQCVKSVLESSGRLIITGIGKSAIIGQKIVATLNSTGTPSIFLHAADAMHGDLGMIRKDDIVMCISKSGETPEVKALVPILLGLGNIMIAMVAKADSYLGSKAGYVLHTPIEKEADPNNLAPTSSTAVQLAMGDALAMSLQVARGFTAKDFAQYHPGGALGKQLYLKVLHLYPNNECPQVEPDASIRQVILEITSKRLGMTAVVRDGHLEGIITDGDLRRMLEREEHTQHLTASDIMSANPKSIDPHQMAVEALSIMTKYSITQLLVAENGVYKGVVHLHDLIREGIG